ncbi:hypothetical protein, partial [Mycobacterium riyadhense]
PYDYPYGFVEDDLAGLDIADLPTTRPATPPRLDDIDIPRLRAHRDAAHQHAQQLADAILTGGAGPPNAQPPPSSPNCTNSSSTNAPTSRP